MIGATYGLQVSACAKTRYRSRVADDSFCRQIVIFLIKREFMLIGWMVIYILA